MFFTAWIPLLLAIGVAAKGQSKFNGQATFFRPGLGACGKTHHENDYIVAMNHHQYREDICHQRVRAHYKGKHVDVTIADACPGCGYGDVDLSPAAFEHLEDKSAGRIDITWEFL